MASLPVLVFVLEFDIFDFLERFVTKRSYVFEVTVPISQPTVTERYRSVEAKLLIQKARRDAIKITWKMEAQEK